MPTATLNVDRLRLYYIRSDKDLFHRYKDELRKRGFSMQHPIDVQRDPSNTFLTLTQGPIEGRVPGNHPELLMYLRQCHVGDFTVITKLHHFLLTNNDDRAQVLEECSVSMPENAGMVTSGYGGTSGTKDHEPDEPVVPWEHVANWKMCQAALLLFGARNEPLP